jgi:hypothetical protein
MRTRELIRREKLLKDEVVKLAVEATMTYSSIDRETAWKCAMLPAKDLVRVQLELRNRGV